MPIVRGQNWLITPAALAVGEPQPASIYDQRWLLVLSGVVEVDVKGASTSQWLNDTIDFLPDLAGPLQWAVERWNIAQPQTPYERLAFALDEWAPSVSLSSIYDAHESIDAGFAVNAWRPTPFQTGADVHLAPPFDLVGNIFTGLRVDVAVRDDDAFLLRISYNITLLGRIIFFRSSPLATGPFKAGFQLVSEIPRKRGAIRAIVYYPATIDGEDAPIADPGPLGFPIAGYAHGNRNIGFPACPGTPTDFSVDYRQLSVILNHLATWGYVIISTDQSQTIDLGEKADMLEASVRYLVAENSRNASPFKDLLRTAGIVLMGHSAGGGAAMALASLTPLSLAAVATLSPSADTSVAAGVNVPLLVEDASEESSEGGNGSQLYFLANPPKHLVFIKGANHFGYTDELCLVGVPQATIVRADQQRIAYAYLTAFLERYARGVLSYDDYLNGSRELDGLAGFNLLIESSV
jgi:pimeloyl-ACP methyl ester carboxylesterase